MTGLAIFSRSLLLQVSILFTAWATPCPETPPSYFSLPYWTTQWEGPSGGNVDGGIQLIDVSGDALVDLVFGYNTGSTNYNCIYINTQCGWILQANYTGPDNSCLPVTTIDLRDVAVSFAKRSVKQFALDVAEEFDLGSRSEVTVRLAASGQKQGINRMMEDLAATPGGFTVQFGTEVFRFSRQ